jgi:hypothetical protein
VVCRARPGSIAPASARLHRARALPNGGLSLRIGLRLGSGWAQARATAWAQPRLNAGSTTAQCGLGSGLRPWLMAQAQQRVKMYIIYYGSTLSCSVTVIPSARRVRKFSSSCVGLVVGTRERSLRSRAHMRTPNIGTNVARSRPVWQCRRRVDVLEFGEGVTGQDQP